MDKTFRGMLFPKNNQQLYGVIKWSSCSHASFDYLPITECDEVFDFFLIISEPHIKPFIFSTVYCIYLMLIKC